MIMIIQTADDCSFLYSALSFPKSLVLSSSSFFTLSFRFSGILMSNH